MDKTIPATQIAALEELYEINKELGHAASQVSPDLHLKACRSSYLIGLLDGAASSGKWPAKKSTA